MSCPLCRERKGKRHCPAKDERICSVCCGGKRLVEIDCPRDCAYLLGMFQQKQVPEKVMDTLLAFLKDSDIKLYAGTKGGTVGVGEGKDGGGSAKERGDKDGRVMAVDALSQIGRDRGAARGDIVAQMRSLRDDNGTDPALRQRIRDVLKDWGQ